MQAVRQRIAAAFKPKQRSNQITASAELPAVSAAHEDAPINVSHDEDAAIRYHLDTHGQMGKNKHHWDIGLSLFAMPGVDTDGLIARLLLGITFLQYDPTKDGDCWEEKTIPFLGRQLMVTILKPSNLEQDIEDHYEVQMRNAMRDLEYLLLAYDKGSEESFHATQKIYEDVMTRTQLSRPQQPWLAGLIIALDTGKPIKVESHAGLEYARKIGFGYHEYNLTIREGCNPGDLEPLVRSLLVLAVEGRKGSQIDSWSLSEIH